MATGLVPLLLLVALIMLLLGLGPSASKWLYGSLVASGLVVVLLVLDRWRAPRPAVPAGPADTPTTPATPATPTTPATPAEVWVVAGRPRYHRDSCDIIATQAAEPIAYEQAVGDGLVPCSLCAPAGG